MARLETLLSQAGVESSKRSTIMSLRMENARLRKAVKASQARTESLEGQLAKLRATGTVLSKALYGRKSEQQEKPRSERPRGQQRGAAGHGRTQRPGLEERTEEHNPPKDARVCSCCAKPYVANGERSSTVIEIEVKAHTRRIVRPRWRRNCDCASSPLEVSAPPVPRLFPQHALRDQLLGTLPVRALCLLPAPAPRCRVAVPTQGWRSRPGRWPTL